MADRDDRICISSYFGHTGLRKKAAFFMSIKGPRGPWAYLATAWIFLVLIHHSTERPTGVLCRKSKPDF
jgi:hypothetical protein